MPRIARIVVAGMPHHVAQRGDGRADVFCDQAGRREYPESQPGRALTPRGPKPKRALQSGVEGMRLSYSRWENVTCGA